MPFFGYQHDGDEMVCCKLWLLIFYFFSCKAERLFFGFSVANVRTISRLEPLPNAKLFWIGT